MFWQKFVAQTGIRDVAEHFDFEVRIAHSEDSDPLFHTTSANYGIKMVSNGIGRDFFSEPLPPEVNFTPWGVALLPWPENPGCEKMFHPLAGVRALKEIEEYPVPDIDEESIEKVRHKAEQIRNRGYLSASYCGSIYEWCHWLRGMEDFMIDLLANPSFAHLLIEKVATFSERLTRVHAQCGVDLLCFYDDYGMQDRLQIPPKIWREFLKPWWTRIIASLRHDYPECLFFLHSCGKIEEILPDLVEVGFDVVHPLQPECHNLQKIVEDYRDRLTFWGTVSAQNTLPLGSGEDVAREITHRVKLALANGNLIVSPSNTLGPETPVENVLIFAEVCQRVRSGERG